MIYNWQTDTRWIKKHLKSGKIISKKVKGGLLIQFEGESMSAKAPQWFKQWSEEEFKPLKEDVSLLKYKVDLIMSCPTIKRELGLMKNPNQRYTRTKRAR